MSSVIIPSVINLALLFGLSFFLGLAFEDFFANARTKRPGGIRTFPMLAIAGGMLYLFEPTLLIPFTAGLLLLGAWLAIFYREHLRENDEQGEPNVGLMVLLLNVHAYLLGAIALALPNWLAVGAAVVPVLLLAGREQLHALARRLELKEIVTLGQFLILTGIILPLLPNEPVTTLTNLTPRHAWLALVLVCTLSYASYLAQRYWAPAAGLFTAALGGLYSSTATTVVLARQARVNESMRAQAQVGITLATGIMYVRVLAIVAVFNLPLARRLAIPLLSLSFAALLIFALQYWFHRPLSSLERIALAQNPLEIRAAAIFAVLFIITSLLSTWMNAQFGTTGVYAMAAVIGVTDIDPFVLNLAQGGTSAVPTDAVAPAILIATSSNNVLKAGYAAIFGGGWTTAPSAAALIMLALTGIFIAFLHPSI